MYFLDKLKNMKFYSNKTFIFPYADNKDKRKGNLYFLSGSSSEDSISILNSKVIKNTYNNAYYIEPIINLNLNFIIKKTKVPQKIEYKNIKSNSSIIKKTFVNLDQYNNLNLFYDMYPHNKLIFGTAYSRAKKILAYKEFLVSLLKEEKLQSYTNKYVIIPFSYKDNTKDIKKSYITEGINNSISALYYMAYYNEELIAELNNLTFVIINDATNSFFKFNSSELNRKQLPKILNFLNLMAKLENKIDLSKEEQALVKEQEKENIEEIDDKEEDIVNNKTTDPILEKIKKGFKIENVDTLSTEENDLQGKLEEIVTNITTKSSKKTDKEILEEIKNDPELIKVVQSIKDEKLASIKSNKSTKRNELLREEQAQIKINNMGKTLDEILKDFSEKKLETREIKNVKLKNIPLKESVLGDFEYSYNKNQNEKDKLAVFSFFSNPENEIPMYIREIKKENTSDSFNRKETWEISYEDERRVRHNIKLDIPIFVNDKFIYLNESKKSITKQLTLIPVVKTGPDEVQVVSNYNKVFLTRYGKKISPKIERLRKFLSKTNSKKIKIKSGDNTLVNNNYLTSIEYDELATSFMNIQIGDINLYFNQDDLRIDIADKKINIEKLKEHELPIGFKKDELIILDTKLGVIIKEDKDISDFIIDELSKLDSNTIKELEEINVGKKYVYNRISILSHKVPLILILGFKDGLSTILHKANIKHEFSDKKRKLSIEEKNKLGVIEFSDSVLYFNLYPFKNSLLLNALYEIPTKNYKYEEFDKKEVYLELFFSLYGTRTIGKGFDNFMELFIDPITKEVLEDLNYPTEFTELMLFANALLEDNAFIKENNMNLYRIRSNEMINIYLYKILAEAYAIYKNSSNSPNPIKFSVPQDRLIKEILASPLIQDYSVINPIKEAEEVGQITYKGPSGLNLAEAYTLDKRSYDKSMLGILSISSPFDAKVGVTRQLSYSPRILSNRGFIKTGDNDDPNLNPANLLSPAELLTPFAATHDDPPRVAMMTSQLISTADYKLL